MNFLLRLFAGACLLAAFSGPALAQAAAPASAAPVARLRGLVLYANPGEVLPISPWPSEVQAALGHRPRSRLVDATRVAAHGETQLVDALSPLLGRPIDARLPDRIVRAVQKVCATGPQPYVTVSVPPQDATSGVIQVVVVAAQVGEVKIAGARWFSEAYYRAALNLLPGAQTSPDAMSAGIDALNRNPFHRVRLEAAAGALPGTTDLTLAVQESRPWRLNAGYSDSGTVTTGLDRLNAGLQWGNAFGRGDLLSYNFSASPDFEQSLSHSGGYTAYLPHQATLALTGNYGTIRPDLEPPFDQQGTSAGASARYTRPLGARSGWSFDFSGGVDFKASDNNLLYGGAPVTDTVTHIYQLSLFVGASRPDARGSTSFGLTLNASPGGIDADNSDAAFDATRAGAKARYATLALDFSRTTRLPADFTWAIDGRAQLATGNLLGSEQLGLGGGTSVRGYDEGEVYGDQGLLVRNELRLPAFGVARHLGAGQASDQLQFVGFVDYGLAANKELLPDEERSVYLLSTGAGLRYSFGSWVSMRLDYGWQLHDTGRNSRVNHRGHFSLNASW